ncbi:hypothetical protein R5R35_014804 [Gryllus longicercus]|uniref:Renin receptor n=1 Tax=Gryllus longicercus TaxID=2509291 RepID=A0AAN9VQ94_9ORTH
MMKLVLCFVAFFAAAFGSGDVTFIHHPKNIYFKGNEIVDQSFLTEIFSASLGFTTNQDSDWSGLRITNPFHYAEAIVVLFVDGIEKLESVKGHHFDLNTDEDEDTIWLNLERRVRNRFPSQNNTLMRVELTEGPNGLVPFYNLIGEADNTVLPDVQFLDLNVTEDRAFLSEISLLQDIVKKVESGSISRDGIPDVYWFLLRGLHAVWDLHSDESPATVEAEQLLKDTVNEMNRAFIKAYEGRVLITMITSDVSHTRQVRQVASPEATRASSVDIKAAPTYDENYPVIFNIILWFMVTFVMALLAICLVIMRMDPGRDSIIYRMTTMKSMKKEN